jgi:hypothetical protein
VASLALPASVPRFPVRASRFDIFGGHIDGRHGHWVAAEDQAVNSNR